MRVLFASGIDGFCHRYAVLHWAEQLATQGIPNTVRAHSDPRLVADLVNHELLVLYRVPWSTWIAHLAERARAHGRAVVFAVDDLIIDSEIRDAPPTRRMSPAERRLWNDGVTRYRRTLLEADAALVTSMPLVEVVRSAGKPAYLHRAGLAAGELALAASAARERGRASDYQARTNGRESVRLGYFSGTPTHDDDFATIAPTLAALMRSTHGVELVIGGALAIDPSLGDLAHRITRLPLVPWPELPALIADTDVALAPLEWQHPFVAAKGAIKYLEAAAVGVPTVASPTEAFRYAIEPGTNGLLAADAGEWRQTLVSVVHDPALRQRLGSAAYADVRCRFGPDRQALELARSFEEIVRMHARPAIVDAAEPLDELALVRAFPGEVARRAREPHGLPGCAITELDAITPPLADGVTLSQSFVATYDGLTRVDVHSITYGLALDHVLTVRVQDDDGTTVADRTIPAGLAPDRDWIAVEFPPQARSAGRRYRIELEAHGTGPRNALSFACTEHAAATEPYAIGGQVAHASLGLRTFAAEPAGVNDATRAPGRSGPTHVAADS